MARSRAADFVDNYLLYLLARASAEASAQFHAIVKNRGVSVLEWRVLAQLAGGSCTVSLLAQRALAQQPTLTKVVDRMARDGLVRRLGDAADRRRVGVSLTEKGRKLAHELIPLARRHEAKILSGYGPRAAASLKRALTALIAHASR
jgi:DNA-binding MarR family transcriptional regulator